jgi:hypothetical protein
VRIEGGQLVTSKTDNRDAIRFQPFPCRG